MPHHPDPDRDADRPLDFLEQARADDRALAAQISREARRPQVPYAHDVVGPTENWRQHELIGVVPHLPVSDEGPGEVAA